MKNMNKKGMGPMIVVGLLLIVVAGVLFIGWDSIKGTFGGSETEGLTIVGPGGASGVVITTTCGDDNKGNINVKLQDDGASSETFIGDSVLYLKDMSSGVIIDNELTNSSSWLTFTDVQCGKEYKVYSVTQATAAGSAQSASFTLGDENKYLKLHTSQISNYQVRIESLETDSANADWAYVEVDGGTEGLTNTTAFVDLNTTNIFDDDSADIAVGESGHLSATVHLKAATNRYQGGDAGTINTGDTNDASSLGLRQFICIDTGSDAEWDADTWTVLVDGVSADTDALDLMDSDSNDYSVVRDSERCALIGDIDSNDHKIYMYIAAKSGQNPDTNNDDLTLYVLSEGTYKANDNGDMIKTGIFTDASTQAGVVYTLGDEDPTFVFNIQ